MLDKELYFVIPTHRLREVGDTIEKYDDHFWRNGHAVRMIVFDDSSFANHDKYYALLERTRTHYPIFYVGPREKAEFIEYVVQRLQDTKLAPLVRDLFRPSYGGNRNYTLMYTLGGLMVSSDDDMRPWALVEDSPETLGPDEVCRGRLYRSDENGYSRKSFDVIRSFCDVLGKRADEVPPNYDRGEHLVDTAMDLETNTTKGLTRENSLILQRGEVAPDSVVKMAQTFRSGTNDIDALDFVDLFLADETQTNIDELHDHYVLVNFRPVLTNRNWRMDCGVAGYHNVFGLPPFFPTRLRFEDYVYRLWIQQPGLVAAHVDAAQDHAKSAYMRNPPASEIFNEEVANLLKRKFKSTITRLDELTIAFDYDGSVSAGDANEVLEKIALFHARAVRAAAAERSAVRARSLLLFAANLEKVFYGFEPDFFQQNLVRVADDVTTLVRSSIELWPTLVEICYFQKQRRGLPQVRIENRRA